MNKILLKISLATIAATMLGACGGPGGNTATPNTNSTNTNAAKPTAAAPTKDALLAMDKQANEAYMKGDSKFFEGFLGDKFVMYNEGHRDDKASSVKMIAGAKCDVKTWSLDEPGMAMIDTDTAVLTYKGTFDGTCNGPDGKPMKMPSPIRAASIYNRSGDKWMAVYHAEVPIVDPTKNPPKPPPAASAKPADKKDDKAAETKPAADPNTEALAAIEKSGWEAWKERDAKKLGDLLTKDASFVDLFGNYAASKDDTIKAWTGGKCEIKSVNVTDAASSSFSPTVSILTFKGSADGTCEGQKIMPVWGTSIYVKEGDTWKLAFGFENPA